MNLKKLETASVFFKEQKTHITLRINSTIYKHYAVNLPYSILCLTALTKRMNGWMNKRKLSHPLLADQFELKNVALTQNNYDSVTFLKGAKGLHSICSDQIAIWQKNILDPWFWHLGWQLQESNTEQNVLADNFYSHSSLQLHLKKKKSKKQNESSKKSKASNAMSLQLLHLKAKQAQN